MTSARTKLAALAGAGALACTGFALAAGPATASTPSPSAKQAACDKAPWEARVQGAPKGFAAGDAAGEYLWHNTDGFHLRVTEPKSAGANVFSGVIQSNEAMRVDRVKLESQDIVATSRDHKTIYFRFVNHGAIDGINFHTDCGRSLHLSGLDENDTALPASAVHLGYYETSPSAIPFTVHRYGGPSGS